MPTECFREWRPVHANVEGEPVHHKIACCFSLANTDSFGESMFSRESTLRGETWCFILVQHHQTKGGKQDSEVGEEITSFPLSVLYSLFLYFLLLFFSQKTLQFRTNDFVKNSTVQHWRFVKSYGLIGRSFESRNNCHLGLLPRQKSFEIQMVVWKRLDSSCHETDKNTFGGTWTIVPCQIRLKSFQVNT